MFFGCHRYKLFLRGAPFTHFIDPETLKPMMENPRKDAPARIERVRLKLQGFDAQIKLISGKKNPADYLSHHLLSLNTCSCAELLEYSDIENHIYYVTSNLPDAITLDCIKTELDKDPLLSEVKSLLLADKRPSSFDHATKKRLHAYINVWDQLSIGKGVILKSEKIVLPGSLFNAAVRLSHSGHLGIQKSKQYLRSSLWFPGMDALVEQQVKACIPCQAAVPLQCKQPLQMSELPAEPWQTIAADLFGPLPSGEKILVLKCLRSKWPELKIFLRHQATNAENVINAMEKIFSSHGILTEIVTDNGPPFSSKAFAEFARNSGFHHRKITPLWPQANGQAENFMKNLGKAIRVAILEKKDWGKSLDNFLATYRATPHPATGYAPATLLRPGQPFKTRLPAAPASVSNQQLEQNFRMATEKAKTYADKRAHAKPSPLKVGDAVLVKQQKTNKFSTPFNASPLMVTKIKGSMVTAKNARGYIVRNSSHFKLLENYQNDPPSTSDHAVERPCPLSTPASDAGSRPKRRVFTTSHTGGGEGNAQNIDQTAPGPVVSRVPETEAPAATIVPATDLRPTTSTAPLSATALPPAPAPVLPNFKPSKIPIAGGHSVKEKNFTLPLSLRLPARAARPERHSGKE